MTDDQESAVLTPLDMQKVQFYVLQKMQAMNLILQSMKKGGIHSSGIQRKQWQTMSR